MLIDEAFAVGTYEITTHDGRQVVARLFKCDREIFDVVGSQPPGVYYVFKVFASIPNAGRESEFWAEITKHENGDVTHSPVQSDP